MVKARLTAASERVQAAVDKEISEMKEAFGPSIEVTLESGWMNGPNKVSFSAKVSNAPDPFHDDD